MDSVVAAPGLQSTGSIVVARGLLVLHSMWDLPRPGIKPMSSALADRFLTIEPPRRPCLVLTACGIWVPQLGIEPIPWAVRAQSPNHWTAKEFSVVIFSTTCQPHFSGSKKSFKTLSFTLSFFNFFFLILIEQNWIFLWKNYQSRSSLGSWLGIFIIFHIRCALHQWV